MWPKKWKCGKIRPHTFKGDSSHETFDFFSGEHQSFVYVALSIWKILLLIVDCAFKKFAIDETIAKFQLHNKKFQTEAPNVQDKGFVTLVTLFRIYVFD